MAKSANDPLSRRERQIMDVVYRLGRVTAAEVQEALPDPPSYSSVRALLRVLEEKGHLRHEQDGPRYVFLPTVAREKARRSALQQLVQTFFDGSTAQTVAALLGAPGSKLTDEDFERLSRLLEKAREEGK
jgi:predicted transcriptional regulator